MNTSKQNVNNVTMIMSHFLTIQEFIKIEEIEIIAYSIIVTGETYNMVTLILRKTTHALIYIGVTEN